MPLVTPRLSPAARAQRPASQVQFVTPQLSRRAGSIADWAEQNIRRSLRAGAGARWSWWKWQRDILETFQLHSVRQATAMIASQMGKTTMGDSIWGQHVDTRTEPVFIVYPTERLLRRAIHDKIEPAIRDCQALRERVGSGKRRDGRLLTHNQENIDFLGGGSLTLAFAGSEALLKNVTARLVMGDEWEDVADPSTALRNMEDRMAMFGSDGKMFIISTPTRANGASPIQQLYLAGDQRQFWVPCQDCGEEQLLEWDNVQRERVLGYGWRGVLPCVHCGVVITNAKRRQMIECGRWIAQEEFYGHASWNISRLYNPEISLDDVCNAWRPGKRDRQKFSAGVLGIPYEPLDETERPEGLWDQVIIPGLPPYEVALTDRNGDFVLDENGEPKRIPAGPDAVTMGVDVQEDRLEYQVNNWYQGERCFSQGHFQIPNPEEDPLSVFGELADVIREYQPDVTLIDFGYKPDWVADGIQKYLSWFATRNRVFGCRGRKREDLDTPVVERMSGTGRNRYWQVATGVARQTRWDMLNQGLMYVWAGGIPENYVRQMEASVLVEEEKPDGTSEYSWKNITGYRDEADDCWNYSYAALRIFQLQGIPRPRNQEIAPDYGQAITAMIRAMYGDGQEVVPQ